MKLRRVLITVAITAVIVLACFLGYRVLFVDQDVLEVKQAELIGAETDWLIGKQYVLSSDTVSCSYYKLGEITKPKGWKAISDENDPDGDPLTTRFTYKKGDVSVLIYAANTADAEAKGERSVLGEHEVYAEADGNTLCLLETPYDSICVCAEFKGLDDKAAQSRIDEVLSAVSVVEAEDKALQYKDINIPRKKSTWLVTNFSNDGADAEYYKIADVSRPSTYNLRKNVDDLDGDPLTTQFAYTKRDTAQGNVYITIYAYPAAQDSLEAQGFEKLTLHHEEDSAKKNSKKEYPDYNVYLKRDTNAYCLIPSPYDDMFICCEVEYPAEFTDEQLLEECYAIAYTVIPAKQLHPTVEQFKLNFIDDDRYKHLVTGLGNTMLLTLLSCLMGVALGTIVASVRSTWQKTKDNMRPGLGKTVFSLFDRLCELYLTVIRGTPVMVQLLIMYLIIFASGNGMTSAVFAFGINSGAYVAEIIRGGILSIDNGQFEAGRSLGFNYFQTMCFIILPQVIKNILPALANEFIALLKETSVAGYVAVHDLNKGGEKIRAVTYSPFMPLIAVALIYLVIVRFFTWLVSLLERSLRGEQIFGKRIKSDEEAQLK